jgi:hypothetical protein
MTLHRSHITSLHDFHVRLVDNKDLYNEPVDSHGMVFIRSLKKVGQFVCIELMFVNGSVGQTLADTQSYKESGGCTTLSKPKVTSLLTCVQESRAMFPQEQSTLN